MITDIREMKIVNNKQNIDVSCVDEIYSVVVAYSLIGSLLFFFSNTIKSIFSETLFFFTEYCFIYIISNN